MTNTIVRRLAPLSLVVLLAGCSTLQSFQRAHSLPEGTIELQGSVGAEGGALSELGPTVARPDAGVGLRYGLSDHVDLLGHVGFASVDVGGLVTLTPPESRFAVAVTITTGLDFAFGDRVDAGLLLGRRFGDDELTLGFRGTAGIMPEAGRTLIFGVGGTLSYAVHLGAFDLVPEISVVRALGRSIPWVDAGGDGSLQTIVHAGLGFQLDLEGTP